MDVIAECRKQAVNAFLRKDMHTEIIFPNGYIYGSGRCGILRNQQMMLSGRIIIDPEEIPDELN